MTLLGMLDAHAHGEKGFCLHVATPWRCSMVEGVPGAVARRQHHVVGAQGIAAVEHRGQRIACCARPCSGASGWISRSDTR